MSRCYACDIPLSNPINDPPTGRVYCIPCFEPTIEEQLRIAGKDYFPPETYELDQVDTNEQETTGDTPKWTEYDENEYFN